MGTKQTAQAEQPGVRASTSDPIVLTGVKLGRMPMEANRPSHPVARFKHPSVPAAGAVVQFKLENGIVYRGVIAEAAEVDGEILAEFTDPLQPKPE